MEDPDEISTQMGKSIQDPYPLYKKLRNEMPIVYSSTVGAYIVSRYSTCNSVLKGPGFGNTPNNLEQMYPAREKYMKNYGDKHPKMKQRSILSLNPPDHTRIRNLVSKAFTPRSVEALKPSIASICEDLLDMKGRNEVDLIGEFAAPLPAYVIAKLMGVPDRDMPMFKRLSDEYAMLFNPLASEDDIYHGLVAKGELGKYFKIIMDEKRNEFSDDLLGRIIREIEDGYNISEEELLTMCSLLLVAGHETTTNLIGNGFYALMKNKEQIDTLKDDRSLIKNAIEEMLRYDAPVQMVIRVAMDDGMIIEGKELKKQDFIAVLIGSANHDESVFTEPEKFDITRKELKHLSFSEGIHFCLGAPLARVEGEIAINALLDHFGNGKIIETPIYRGNYNMRGLEYLRVSF